MVKKYNEIEMTLKDITYLSLGLGSTSPLLALVVGGHIISLMTISLIMVFVDLLYGPKIHDNYIKKTYLYDIFFKWMIISVLASIFGFVYFISFRSDYSYSAISYIPKIFLYILLLILLAQNRKREQKCKLIISGIKYGITINLIWSVIDAIMYYSTHESLTNIVFQSYISAADMHHGVASIVDGITIRSVGLNNDPATIGFFATVASAYSFVANKKWIVFLAIFASLASVSFVGLVGITIVVLFLIISTGQSRLFRKIIASLLFIATCIWIINLSNSSIIDSFKTAIELRAESKSEDDHSTSVRKLFILSFPNAVAHVPTSMIIGTGYSTAVYPYYLEGLDYGGNDSPTTMENTYVDNFFSFGLIGFIYFLMFHYQMYKKARNKLRVDYCDETITLYSFSLAIPISYMFYHYTVYSVIMLISICSILCLGNIKKQKVIV